MQADDTLDLAILDTGDAARAIVVARARHDLAIEPLACAPVQALIAFREQLATAAAGHGQRPTEAALADFGRALFQLVVRNGVDRIYQRLPGTSHIRLQIVSDRPDLQSLPWEFLVQPGTVSGPNLLRSVVRVVPTVGLDAPEPTKQGQRLRILFVYAEPNDQSSVSWNDIRDTIQQEFEVRTQDQVELDVVEGSSTDALDALDAKAYDILHFAGHGRVRNGDGELLFKNRKTNRSQPLSAQQLGVQLRGKGLGLVVLSACSTSAGDFAKEFAVLAKTLVEAGVAAVVANQFPVTNGVAAMFAGAFYRELRRSGDVDQATTKGRVKLHGEPKLANGAARFEWGIPTLYRHSGAARIFAP